MFSSFHSISFFFSLKCLNVGSSQLILHCKTIILSMYREAGKVVGEVEVRGNGNLGNGVNILLIRVSILTCLREGSTFGGFGSLLGVPTPDSGQNPSGKSHVRSGVIRPSQPGTVVPGLTMEGAGIWI